MSVEQVEESKRVVFPKNTQQVTQWAVKCLETWLKQCNEQCPSEKYARTLWYRVTHNRKASFPTQCEQGVIYIIPEVDMLYITPCGAFDPPMHASWDIF